MASEKKALGILVGGGPAPGINGVISAATIEAINQGVPVIGFYEGYKHLMAGREDQIVRLDIEKVSRIHFLGGSILRTARANPTKKPEHLETVVKTLEKLNVGYLMTIGGDDTGFSASRIGKQAAGRITIAHVPKTIDNDLPLPPSIPTFGYQTARAEGVRIIKNLMADAKTSPRWYIVVAMGRKAGHLALGIGKASGAPLTIIPEEFRGQPITLKKICDIVDGSILKRKAVGRDHGVCILAEGLLEAMTPEHIEEIFDDDELDRDEHGHLKLDNLELGRKVRDELRKRFTKRGVKTQLIFKNLGYELRCCDPIPFDIEYTRDLGYGAAKFLLNGGSDAIISFYGGKMMPLMFDDVRDPATGRPKVRMVEVDAESFEVARRYMMRLESSDRSSSEKIQKLADAANMTNEQFMEYFGYLMQ